MGTMQTTAGFLSSVYYPPFNVDVQDARELGDAFALHCRAIEEGEGIKQVEKAISLEREALLSKWNMALVAWRRDSDVDPACTAEQAASEQRTALALGRLVAGYTCPTGTSDALAFFSSLESTTTGRARAWHMLDRHGAFSAKEGDQGKLCALA